MGSNSLALRLQHAFDMFSKLTKKELAEKTDISMSYLNKIFKGVTLHQPPADIVYRLATALGIDYVWLITGKGDPLPSHTVRVAEQSDDDCTAIKAYKIMLSCGGGAYAPSYEVITDESPVYFKSSWFKEHNVNPEECRRFKAHGDSMEPIIMDGDYVTVDCSDWARTRIQNNKIYAIINDDLLCCKYIIRKFDGSVIIRSANEIYTPEVMTEEEAASKLIIIGRVLERSGNIN